jgi:cytochrome c oxidase subunit 4
MTSKSPSLESTLVVGAALIALWALSFALSFVAMGAWALPVALAIAVVKAGLVVCFFMELARERASVVYAFAVGLLMVALLLVFVVADVLTRS